MSLAVTSDVAPDWTLAERDAACRARGLDGQELVIDPAVDLATLAARVQASGARVVALRAHALTARDAAMLAATSAAFGVPVSVPLDAVAPAVVPSLAATFARGGGRLLLAQRTDLEAMVALAEVIHATPDGAALGIAWELRPSTERLTDAGAIIFAVRDLLGLVRLHGGGPEQREQDGRGVGALLADLALTRVAAPIVLCPSTPARRPDWCVWLASRKRVGCGHGKDPRRLDVDVRDVEPRDRLETILGAYHRLGPGATLHLTVDHDPSCMFYTLDATEPPGSFEFRTVEDGPEVWRAEVTRR